MADGARRHAWAQTANVLALLANCHRDPKRKPKPFAPDDFMPQDLLPRKGKAAGEKVMKAPVSALRALFCSTPAAAPTAPTNPSTTGAA